MNEVYEYTIKRQRMAEPLAKFSTPLDIVSTVQRITDATGMSSDDQEHLYVFALDMRSKVLGYTELYRGNVGGTPVRVAEVLRLAILANASAIAIAHNHPSGDTSPSNDDLIITKEIGKAAALFDITLLDHVIVAEGGRYTSLRAIDSLSSLSQED